MIVSVSASFLLQWLVIKPKLGGPTFQQLWDYKQLLIPMGICTFLTSGLNNESLSRMPLFLDRAINATKPMPTMLFSFLFAKKTYSAFLMFVVFFLCLGSVLSVSFSFAHNQGGSEIAGVVMCVVGMLAASIKPVLVMMLTSGLQGDITKLEPTVVLVYDSGIAFTLMLITWLCLDERQESIAYLSDPDTRAIGIIIIATGSTMAFAFNLSNFYVITLTTALTAAVGGSGVCGVLLILVSAVQAGLTDPVSWCGIGTVIISLCVYTYLTLENRKPPAPDKEDTDKRVMETTPLVKP
jgi:drug/metabolite transporter (DMT)-like permease